MIRRIAMLFALIALPALAQAQGLIKRAPAALDPEKAYVVVELGQMDGAMMPGSLTIARYDAERKDIADHTPRAPVSKKGKFILDNRLFFNSNPILKDGKRRLLVAEVKPGLWVIEGANDTAFSLGSSTLQLEPGSVTDLGVANIYSDFPEGEKRDVATTGRVLKGALMGGIFGSVLPKPIPRAVDFRAREASDLQLPAPFAAAAKPVAWTGQVEFGNYLGGMVNRMGGIKSRPGAAVPASAPITPTVVSPPVDAMPST
jgi:hypothetical protein